MTTHINWSVRLTLSIKLYAAALWLAEAPWTVEDRSSFSDVGLAGVGFGSSNYNTHTVQREKKMKEAVSILIRLWGIFIREQDKHNSVPIHKKSTGSFVKKSGFEHQSWKATSILLCWRRQMRADVGKPVACWVIIKMRFKLKQTRHLKHIFSYISRIVTFSLIFLEFKSLILALFLLRFKYNKDQQATYDLWGNGLSHNQPYRAELCNSVAMCNG